MTRLCRIAWTAIAATLGVIGATVGPTVARVGLTAMAAVVVVGEVAVLARRRS